VRFKHQSVRDLAWAVSSPPLISQPDNRSADQCLWPDRFWFQQAYDETLSTLKDTDKNPAKLDGLLASQKDRRLGKYFETLWLYWFSVHPRYKIIANNLQIIIDGETLGEIDFIILDKTTGLTVHWEVAVKFYLGVGDTLQMYNWHGPNLRDRLDIKVSHLINRQSKLSRNERVQQWLQEKSITVDKCAVILKGRLYYPWQYKNISTEATSIQSISPEKCALQHEYSWWLTRSQFDSEVAGSEQMIALLNKGWLERISTGSVKEFDTKNTIYQNEFKKILRFPVHVQLCNARHSKDRVFLTDDNWPVKKT